ncbi:MAG: hypothetical protein E7554_00615 [Ruminococcaceae bacterium]|nr:hypothetical protein [Oscillospiraceae bacterium]
MKLARCEKGHFYDADIYGVCPHCGVLPPAADMIPDHILPAGVNPVEEGADIGSVPEYIPGDVSAHADEELSKPEAPAEPGTPFPFEPIPRVDPNERVLRAGELTQGGFAREEASEPQVSRLIISGMTRSAEPAAEPPQISQQPPVEQSAPQPVEQEEVRQKPIQEQEPQPADEELKMTAGDFSARIIFRGSGPVDINSYDYSIVHNGPAPVPNPPSARRADKAEELHVQPELTEESASVTAAAEPETEEPAVENVAEDVVVADILSRSEGRPVEPEPGLPAEVIAPQPEETVRPEPPVNIAVLPVGWLVCTDPECCGLQLTLLGGMSYIGREPEVFGSLQVAGCPELMNRAAASIEYDEAAREYIFTALPGMGEFRINGRRPEGRYRLCSKDRIAIEGRSYIFIALCGNDFGWR